MEEGAGRLITSIVMARTLFLIVKFYALTVMLERGHIKVNISKV